jgi:hypothetical protein
MIKECLAWMPPFCAATIFFLHTIRIRNAAWRSRGQDEKTRWPPLQGHVVRSERKRMMGWKKTRWPPLQGHVVRRERKRMMAARKQYGRRFRATWWGARGRGWWLPENKMAAASGPRGEEREEEDDGCQKVNTSSVPHVQVFFACEKMDEYISRWFQATSTTQILVGGLLMHDQGIPAL